MGLFRVLMVLIALSCNAYADDGDDFDYGSNAGNGGNSSNYGVGDDFKG